MGIDTETDIEIELLFDERTEDPCEHSEHAERPYAHSGFGEWLVRVVVDCCKKESHDILVCDRFKRFVIEHPNQLVHCSECNVRVNKENRFIILGRKGVDF